MILTFIGDTSSIFQKGKDYFCLEIYVNLRMNRVSFSIVNPYGEIGIYDSNDFEIKQGELVNMVMIQDKSFDFYTLQLKEIQELDSTCKDVNGIWGAYHDGDKEIEEKVHAIVMNQAKKEGFYLERVVAV